MIADQAADIEPGPAALLARVAAREWYHTLELAPGVVTPGWFDTRPIADRVLPASTAGQRCLDIATFDGFWAFSMEARGSREVVAIDILDEERWDWPATDTEVAREAIARRKGGGDGFEIAKEALGSAVERLDCSVYDLDPDVHGQFDLVYLGSLLLHLRDPIGALERVRSVCRGTLIAVDALSLHLSLIPRPVASLDGLGRPYWWKPNRRALERMIASAGFEALGRARVFFMPPGRGMHRAPLRPVSLRSRAGRELLLGSRIGDPHAWIRARPREIA